MKTNLYQHLKLAAFCLLLHSVSTIAQTSCSAHFTWTQTSANNISLDASSSVGTSPNTSYYWDFGNGITGSGKTPATVFNIPGKYHVCLSIQDSSTFICHSSFCDTVTVTGTVICNLVVSTSSNNSTCSTCADGQAQVTYIQGGAGPYAYTWSPSGGSSSVASGLAAGTYSVCITDANNCHVCQQVVVSSNNNNCHASFTHRQTAANTIEFTSNSTSLPSLPAYAWNFGDNNSLPYDTARTVSHVYLNPGLYTVSLGLRDSTKPYGVGCSSTASDTVHVGGSVICVMHSTAQSLGTTCSTCADGIAYVQTITGGASPYTYSWSTGATTDSAFHLTTGSYTVCITDANGCHSCDTIPVHYNPHGPCYADFKSAYAGNNTFNFTSTSTGLFGYYTQFSWNFGDNSPAGYSNQSSHTYAAPGLYTVCLTMNDTTTSGVPCTSMFCDTVHIAGTAPGCNASYTLVADTAHSGNYIAVNNSSGTGPINYVWSWGDGHSDSIATPTHTYASAGLYTICLHLRDGVGCISSQCDSMRSARYASTIKHTTIKVIMGSAGINESKLLTNINLYPNPSSGMTTLSYSLSKSGSVTITLFDALGRQMMDQGFTSNLGAGMHETNFDLAQLAPGIYLLRIQAGESSQVKRISIIH
jgi:PKD repeat protein